MDNSVDWHRFFRIIHRGNSGQKLKPNTRIHDKMKTQKKAAIELSIGTIVIVVLGMTMLIIGIVLVTKIGKTATQSIDTIDTKLQQEIVKLFTNDESNVIVNLGPDHTALIKPSDKSFGLAIAARTLDGSKTSFDRLKYKLTLDQNTATNCIKTLGLAKTKSLFITSLETMNIFDQYQDANTFAIIQIKVAKGTPTCTQKVYVTVKDSTTNEDVGGDFFIIDILK